MTKPLLVPVPAEFAWVVERAIREAMVKVEQYKADPDPMLRDWTRTGVVLVAVLAPAKDEPLTDTQLREVA